MTDHRASRFNLVAQQRLFNEVFVGHFLLFTRRLLVTMQVNGFPIRVEVAAFS